MHDSLIFGHLAAGLQSRSSPLRSQLHSQGYFNIAETAEDGHRPTAGCSRRHVIRRNNNITKEVIIKYIYLGHKLIKSELCRITQ